jgi:hypothetical protein
VSTKIFTATSPSLETYIEPIGGLQESPPIELEARSLHNRAGIQD